MERKALENYHGEENFPGLGYHSQIRIQQKAEMVLRLMQTELPVAHLLEARDLNKSLRFGIFRIIPYIVKVLPSSRYTNNKVVFPIKQMEIPTFL